MSKILVLGGTQFVGRNMVERLLNESDMDVTLFNRQLTDMEAFPDVSKIKGDRQTDDILQIGKDSWDVVIDFSCYYPKSMETALKALKPGVKRYIFISTCSAYNNSLLDPLKTEETPLLDCTEQQKTDTSPDTYGNRKGECERVLQASGIDYTILRPALIFGKYDHTDRLYYWLHQVHDYSKLLMPDNGERKFSLTYVGHLVEAVMQAIRSDISGVYNMISYESSSIGQIVDAATDVFGKTPEYVNASPSFLHEKNISQWLDMPLWIDGDHFTYSNQKLRNDFQLNMEDFKANVAKTISYCETLNWPVPQYGIMEHERQELLQALNN